MYYYRALVYKWVLYKLQITQKNVIQSGILIVHVSSFIYVLIYTCSYIDLRPHHLHEYSRDLIS